jgi:hypothetical protein
MLYKRGRYFWLKFKWRGKLIRKSTRASDLDIAHQVERRIRAALAKSYARTAKVKGDPLLFSLLYQDLSTVRKKKREMRAKDALRLKRLRAQEQGDAAFLGSMGIDPEPERPE